MKVAVPKMPTSTSPEISLPLTVPVNVEFLRSEALAAHRRRPRDRVALERAPGNDDTLAHRVGTFHRPADFLAVRLEGHRRLTRDDLGVDVVRRDRHLPSAVDCHARNPFVMNGRTVSPACERTSAPPDPSGGVHTECQIVLQRVPLGHVTIPVVPSPHVRMSRGRPIVAMTESKLAQRKGPRLADGKYMGDLIDLEKREVAMRVYSDPEIYQFELDRIFNRSWLKVGHVSEIPNPGDYMLSYMGEDSVIVIRGRDNQVRILLNVCSHRGMEVCWGARGEHAHVHVSVPLVGVQRRGQAGRGAAQGRHVRQGLGPHRLRPQGRAHRLPPRLHLGELRRQRRVPRGVDGRGLRLLPRRALRGIRGLRAAGTGPRRHLQGELEDRRRPEHRRRVPRARHAQGDRRSGHDALERPAQHVRHA